MKLQRIDSTGETDKIFVKEFSQNQFSKSVFSRGSAAACTVMDEKQELAERFNG